MTLIDRSPTVSRAVRSLVARPLVGVGATGKTIDPGGTDVLSNALLAAAADLDLYLSQKGCDCSTTLISKTASFQNAFNTAVSSGSQPGPQISADGKYGNGMRDLLASILGRNDVPSACYSAGNPCFGVPPGGTPGSGGVTPPAPAPAPAPAPTPAPPVVVTPPTTIIPVSATTTSSSALPWVLGGLALATGVGAVAFLRHKQAHGASMIAPRRGGSRRRRR